MELQDLDKKYLKKYDTLIWIELLGGYLMLVVICIQVYMMWRHKRKSSLEVKILASMFIYYALGAFYLTDSKLFGGKVFGHKKTMIRTIL